MALLVVSPQLAPPAAPPQSNEAGTIVASVMADASNMAVAAQANALDAITALGSFHLELPVLTVPSIPIPTVNVPTLGAAPTEPAGTNAVFPTLPSAPTIAPLGTIALGAEPEFAVASPLLIDVPLPDPLAAVLPSAPTLATVAMPIEPGFVLPAVPTMLALNIPGAPVLDIPAFTEILAAAPVAPTETFTWAEVTYDTAMLGLLNSRLTDMVAGASTGLTPAVEDAIWQRGRDREALLSQRAVEEAQRMFAARGFSMPSGTLLRIVQQALQDSMGRDATLSREVMIKQGELEQSNFQFAFNSAIQLETLLLNHFNTVQSRALDAAKFTFDAVLQVFAAKVQLYQADAQAFGIKAEVFKTRLQAALAQLDIYRAELEGQRLIGEMNGQLVNQYVGQLQGVRASVDVYANRVAAARVQIEAQQQQVGIFVAQLQGYDSQVKSKATEYESYATRVRAELTKVQMFGEEVGAYKSRVEAYGTLVNAKLGVQTLDFKQLQEFPLELYKQQVQTYQTGVAAESERVKALVNLFEGRVRAFGTLESAKSAQVGAQVEAVRATTAVYTSQAQLALQAGETNLRLAVTASETAQASLRAAGQVSGQLAAAAMAARNVHASIQQSDSNSSSNARSLANSNQSGFSTSGSVSDITTHNGD